MTKKHYEAIASVIKYRIDHYDNIGEFPAIVQVAEDLADYFESDNPRFDRERFLTACGLGNKRIELP